MWWMDLKCLLHSKIGRNTMKNEFCMFKSKEPIENDTNDIIYVIFIGWMIYPKLPKEWQCISSFNLC